IRIVCPACRAPHDVSEDRSGEHVSCPSCRHTFAVEPPTQATQLEATRSWGPRVPGEAKKQTAPGQELARVPGYEVLEELGRGGMGVVYKARQLGLNRIVALKMIRGGSHAGPEELARFRVEAEALARLQHSNIVQVFEVGEHDGLPFFSLELCDGG